MPPRANPQPEPMAAKELKILMDRFLSAGSVNVFVMIDKADGITMAAARPCSALKAVSNIKLGERHAPSEVNKNRPAPAKKMVLRPMVSHNLPPITRKPP